MKLFWGAFITQFHYNKSRIKNNLNAYQPRKKRVMKDFVHNIRLICEPLFASIRDKHDHPVVHDQRKPACDRQQVLSEGRMRVSDDLIASEHLPVVRLLKTP